jgi:O-antigen ligase
MLGCWQHPFEKSNYDYLLSLSMYPIAAFSVKALNPQFFQNSGFKIWTVATIIGIAYPLFNYFGHIVSFNEAYGMGKSLPTFMDTDHVRFGIFLCAGFLMILLYGNKEKPIYKWLMGGMAFVILFLAVRTAWILLLIICIAYAIEQIRLPTSIKKSFGIKHLVSALAIVMIAFLLFPTIRQKLAYTVYDWQQYQPGRYDSNYSDAARRAVNFSAWQSVKQPGGSNTGWANIPAVLEIQFSKIYPGTHLNYGWPFNQYLFWWMGSGWWGMLAFSGWLLFPVYWGWKHHQIGLVGWTLAIAVSCLVESTLQLQYGIWLHAWLIAIIWQLGNEQKKVAGID